MDNAKLPNTAQRILQIPLARLIFGFVVVFVLVVIVQLAVQLIPPLPVLRLVRGLLVSAAALAAYVIFVRRVEKRPVTELSLTPAWWAETGIGFVFGTLLFCAVIGFIALLGYYRVTGVNDWTALFAAFGGATVSGFFEEVLFRGLLFRILEEWLGTWIALAISAGLFGLLHLISPGATLSGAFAVAMEGGWLLATAYALTRRLWLAIGMHTAWDFVQGGIFGVAVSGNEIGGLLQARLTGPEILTGGAFGAEASLIALIVCTVAGAALLWLAYGRGHVHARPAPAPEAAAGAA